MKRTTIAVITPMFNGAEWIAECIQSVRRQTYPNWIHIVADNASEDDSVARAREAAGSDPRVVVREFTEHVGMMGSWNRALEQVPPDVEWVKMLLCDDTLMPECLSEMQAAAMPGVVMVAGYRKDGLDVAPRGLPLSETRVPGSRVVRDILLEERDLIGYPTHVMTRTATMREVGFRFDERPWPPTHPSPPTAWGVDKLPLLYLVAAGDLAFVHRLLTHQRQRADGNTATCDRLRMHVPGYLNRVQICGDVLMDEANNARRTSRLVNDYWLLMLKQTAKGRVLRDEEFRTYHEAATRALADSFRCDGKAATARRLGMLNGLIRAQERLTALRR